MRELGHRVHLIGIGGEGMAGLAHLLMEGGTTVSGSDLRDSPRLWALRREGAEVFVGHGADHIPPGTKTVVFSSAVTEANPELGAARLGGLKVLGRLPALGEVLRGRRLVAVVGTHGKTTTTTWTAHLVRAVAGEGGYYVGADIPEQAQACLGGGWFVAEVDESDGQFMALRADVAVLTSLDSDHLGTYGGMAGLSAAFRRFLAKAGRVALCLDDPGARGLLPLRPHPLTYGLSQEAALRAVGPKFSRSRVTFEVQLSGRKEGTVELPAPGVHNVRNALGAIAAGLLCGLPPAELCAALGRAPKPRRRLEILEENGYMVVDDYAHHPSEIAAGVSALRAGWPERQIVAIFQPHRFSRTLLLHRELGQALTGADEVVVTEIYPAFEPPIPRVSGKWVAQAAGSKARFSPTLEGAMEQAAEVVRPGNIVVCFGAGDIWKAAREMARGC
jgi:UDP-N-acetylmuramate--alanine ligase